MEPEQAQDPRDALAAVLRDAAAALALREVSASAAREALAHAESLRAALAAPPRPRWYDHDAASPLSPDARSAYGEQSPLRGLHNVIAPPLTVERLEGPDGLRLIGRVTLNRSYEGPPHGVHGGIVAALFDEMLGGAQGLAPPPGVTALLEVRYRELTPIETPLVFEAWIEDARERRITARATCHAGDRLTADATGTFIRVDFEQVEQRMASGRD
jgi:acyl-coenzyme A thioesterase PaaI-like protein